MKSLYLRAAAALMVTLALSACGGKASFTVGGVVTGLTNPNLVLASNGSTVSLASGATSFTFPNPIDYGVTYDVLVQTQPDHMTCVVTGGNNSAGHLATIMATVTCVQNTYLLGGTITNSSASGRSIAGLVLGNGSTLPNGNIPTPVSPAAGATSFVFANSVPDGTTYSVGVVAQPSSGLVCSVGPNGTGTMANAAVLVSVTCVDPTPPPS